MADRIIAVPQACVCGVVPGCSACNGTGTVLRRADSNESAIAIEEGDPHRPSFVELERAWSASTVEADKLRAEVEFWKESAGALAKELEPYRAAKNERLKSSITRLGAVREAAVKAGAVDGGYYAMMSESAAPASEPTSCEAVNGVLTPKPADPTPAFDFCKGKHLPATCGASALVCAQRLKAGGRRCCEGCTHEHKPAEPVCECGRAAKEKP